MIVKPRSVKPAILTGLLFDETERPMTASYSINPTGRRYRYYLSRLVEDGTDTAPPSRIPALLVERAVKLLLARWSAVLRDGEELSEDGSSIRLRRAAPG